MLLAMANALLFLVVPTGRYVDKYPTNLSLAIGCDGTGLVTLTDLDSENCTFKDSSSYNLTLRVNECGYVCMDHKKSSSNGLEKSKSMLPPDWPDSDQPYKKFRKAIFLPETWNFNVSCAERESCIVQPSGNKRAPSNNVTLNNIALIADNNAKLRATQRLNGVLRSFKCGASYGGHVALNSSLVFHSIDSLNKERGVLRKRETMANLNDEEDVEYTECWSECIAQVKRSDWCVEDSWVVEYDPQLTFWLYLVLRVFYAILLGGSMVLFEGACLAVVIEYKGDLGLQRLFGIMGTMIFSPVSGALIDYFSVDRSVPDFR